MQLAQYHQQNMLSLQQYNNSRAPANPLFSELGNNAFWSNPPYIVPNPPEIGRGRQAPSTQNVTPLKNEPPGKLRRSRNNSESNSKTRAAKKKAAAAIHAGAAGKGSAGKNSAGNKKGGSKAGDNDYGFEEVRQKKKVPDEAPASGTAGTRFNNE